MHLFGRLALLVCALVFAASGESTGRSDYKDVTVERKGNAVEVRLPLTDVTGKVRTKARVDGRLGEVVAPSQTSLGAGHYLEWQIGYDTPERDRPALADGIEFVRKGKRKYGAELSKILQESLCAGVVTAASLGAVRTELASFARTSMAENEAITLVPLSISGGGLPPGFARWQEAVPVYLKTTPFGTIQIELKPKQRAVGYQPMLYVCLPFERWLGRDGKPRVGGRATPRETVTYRFDAESSGFLLDIVRGFGAASPQHAEDLTQIIDSILSRTK